MTSSMTGLYVARSPEGQRSSVMILADNGENIYIYVARTPGPQRVKAHLTDNGENILSEDGKDTRAKPKGLIWDHPGF